MNMTCNEFQILHTYLTYPQIIKFEKWKCIVAMPIIFYAKYITSYQLQNHKCNAILDRASWNILHSKFFSFFAFTHVLLHPEKCKIIILNPLHVLSAYKNTSIRLMGHVIHSYRIPQYWSYMCVWMSKHLQFIWTISRYIHTHTSEITYDD